MIEAVLVVAGTEIEAVLVGAGTAIEAALVDGTEAALVVDIVVDMVAGCEVGRCKELEQFGNPFSSRPSSRLSWWLSEFL